MSHPDLAVLWLREGLAALLQQLPPPAPPPSLPAAEGWIVQLREASGGLRASVGRSKLRGQALDGARLLELAQALLDDPRFPPLQPEELSGLDLELWLLGPERRLSSLEAFRPREEALLVQQGLQSALLLPDIPEGWSARDALAYACSLAGLEGRAFEQEGTLLWVREATLQRAPRLGAEAASRRIAS